MSTATLNKAEKEVKKITGKIIEPGAENKFSTLVHVIHIFTDKKSYKNSENLLAVLDEIIDNKLPIVDEEINVKAAQKNYATVNKILNKVDKFLDFISKLTNSGHEIEMDTVPTMELLCNLQKAQKKLKFISDYLSVLIQVNNDKKKPKFKSSISELITKIKAA